MRHWFKKRSLSRNLLFSFCFLCKKNKVEFVLFFLSRKNRILCWVEARQCCLVYKNVWKKKSLNWQHQTLLSKYPQQQKPKFTLTFSSFSRQDHCAGRSQIFSVVRRFNIGVIAHVWKHVVVSRWIRRDGSAARASQMLLNFVFLKLLFVYFGCGGLNSVNKWLENCSISLTPRTYTIHF